MPSSTKKPAPKAKKKAPKKLTPQDEALDLTLQHIHFKEMAAKAKKGLSEIRARLRDLVLKLGTPSGRSHTVTFEEEGVFAQRQLSGGGPSVSADAAAALILKKYPHLKGKVFCDFNMEAFAKLALDGKIKKADLRKVTEEKDPIEKLVVDKVKHGKRKSD